MSFLHRLGPAAAIGTALLAIGLPAAGAAAPPRSEPAPTERPFLDVREDAAGREARATPAQESLRRSLGIQGVVDVDPLTGTPRVVARLDGFLTGPSEREAVDVVLDYVRANSGVFKLDEDDLAGLRIVRNEVDAFGVRHLLWAQTVAGIRAFDNDLRASVTADGRILNVMGSPLPDLELPTDAASLGAGSALAAALRDAGRDVALPRTVRAARSAARTTRFAGGHRAGLVLVNDGRGVRLAWRVTAHADSDEVYDTLVDASSGQILRRTNEVESVDAMGEGFDYYPGAALGGSPTLENWTVKGWLPADATTLDGPYARVFADLDDDDKVGAVNEEANEADSTWEYGLTTFTHESGMCLGGSNSLFVSTCTWQWDGPASWAGNRKQNSAQVFYFVNTFHDHLTGDPDIAWTERVFEGDDRVIAHANDGASMSNFLPDANHVNNANMLTPPDGQSPTMQMYLFTSWTGDFATDPTPDANGGDDAAVVYHEYTHGLSNRLVTDVDGSGALDAFQSGAMGEGWSDFYALDYLVAEGFAPDSAAEGDVVLDRYLGNDRPAIRTQGLDCPVASVSPKCPGGHATGGGGYTLGDMGHVWQGGAEVHADGEIWAQTLWDLRAATGVADARFLVTEAMRLSPANPSFLDMRNAILQANEAGVFNGRPDHETAIWQVFAARGMGYFAAVGHASDTNPVESFAMPPDPSAGVGSLTGTVTDADTGAPLAGVQVTFTSLGLAVTTDALGQYAITDVPVGNYPEVTATRSGYGGFVSPVEIHAGIELVLNIPLRRNWAAHGGGGRIHTWAGPSYDGCGPAEAIDGSLLTGWSTDGTLPSITVRLPKYVDVTAFAVDPGAVCGDPESASLKSYRVHVSATGAKGSWTNVKNGSFALAEAHSLNTVQIAKRRGIRYARLTALSNHSGGDYPYIDVAELEVYGPTSLLCRGVGATRVGTNGRNTMNGTAGRDVILGRGGNDRINGRGGNDVICGGSGADVLIGGPGVDKFDGGSGNDTIYSRDKKRETTVRGGTGRDRVRKDKADRTTSVERSF